MPAGYDQHRDVVPFLDVVDALALLVEQVGGRIDRQVGDDLGGILLDRLFLDDAQHRQGQRFHAADAALAAAARAGEEAGFAQRRPQALARHFQQPEARDAAQLDARPVHLHRLAQAILDGPLIAGRHHVDEVDHEQATKVAQAQLAGDFVGGFKVGVERGFLDVPALGGAGRVDVDRGQGLRVIDDDGAAGRQGHLAAVGQLDLALDLVTVEQRDVVLVVARLVDELRHHLLQETPDQLEGTGVVDEDLVDVAAQVIAQGADDDVALLEHQQRRRLFPCRALDGIPQLQQVVEIPLQLLHRFAATRGADDQAHAFRDLQRGHDLAHVGAGIALDAAGDAAGARVVGHQHQVAAGQADIGGQRRTLGAAFLLLDLDQQLLAFLQVFLDVAAADFLLGWQAEIGRDDLLERQEAMAFRAEIDEGGFQAGLDPADDALVDVGLFLLPGRNLDVKVVEFLAIHQRDPEFFRLRGIDQHSFHSLIL